MINLTGADMTSTKSARSGSVREAAVGPFDRVSPVLLNGNGFSTSLVFTNLDIKTIYLDVYFVTSDGNDLVLPVSGIGSASRIVATIPVNQSITIDTDGSGEFQEGYAAFYTLDRPATANGVQVTMANLGSSAIVQGVGGDGSNFEASVPALPAYESRFTLPFDNRRGIKTLVTLINSHTAPSPISVTVRNAAGNIIGKDTSISIKPFQRFAFLLNDAFPDSQDLTGVMQVSTSALGVSGLAMRIDRNDRFTAVQTLSAVTNPEAPAQPTPTPTGALPGLPPGNSCSSIEGSTIFANDGQFLGKVTANTFDPDSIGNTFGSYGSQYSSTSMFNSFGTYGGEYSSLSPFNSYTQTPPIIFVNSKPAAYLTTNISKTPRVTLTALYPCIGRK
jgi:hypothetical protein